MPRWEFLAKGVQNAAGRASRAPVPLEALASRRVGYEGFGCVNTVKPDSSDAVFSCYPRPVYGPRGAGRDATATLQTSSCLSALSILGTLST